MRKALRIIISIPLLLATLFGLLLGALSLNEWWPVVDDKYAVQGGDKSPVPPTIKVLTWNIGYAAMDRETDFFMDGGKMSRGRSVDAVKTNLAAVESVLRERKPDFALLQEVDVDSARSYGVAEKAQLEQSFSSYASIFTRNYNVPFVPVPVSHPMGGAQSAILTLRRLRPPRHAARRPRHAHDHGGSVLAA